MLALYQGQLGRKKTKNIKTALNCLYTTDSLQYSKVFKRVNINQRSWKFFKNNLPLKHTLVLPDSLGLRIKTPNVF